MKKIIMILFCSYGYQMYGQTPPDYPPPPPAATNVTSIEYLFDANPNFGSGTAITGFTPSTNISNFNSAVSLTGLPMGFHRIYFRTKNENNNGSLVSNVFFDNYTVPVYNPASPPVTNIVAIEYFLDNHDLGFGNCTPISSSGTNIVGLNANINITGLAPGVHRLFIRSKDADGKWSITNFSLFDNSSVKDYPLAPAGAPPIGQIEYYIDSDPGFGNGNVVTVPGNTGDLNNYSVDIPLSGNLGAGTHYLYIRSRQNPWSMTSIVPFSTNSALPLHWQFIKGQLVDKNGVISWGTAQEMNTKEFEVEHSTDGTHFTTLNIQPAAGNSSDLRSYSYTHINLSPGLHYYRIKQIDIDDRFAYSPVVTILYKDGLLKTILAPNPAVNYTLILLNKPAKNASATIYSMDGKMIAWTSISNGNMQQQLNVSQLAKGEYMIEIINNEVKELLKMIK